MWLILACGLGGCTDVDIRLARASGWNAEAAIVGFVDPEHPNWPRRWYSGSGGDAPVERFETQRDCLTALRREMPEGEEWSTYANSGEGWETKNTIHGPDYVEQYAAVGWEEGRANMMRTYYYACFREPARTS